ncbi:MAG: diacylglycerol kinase family protein [Candidatus Saccharimonadales bacterium]
MSIEHNGGFVVLRNRFSTNARHAQGYIDEIETNYGNVRHIETSSDWFQDAETIAAELGAGDTLVAIGGDSTQNSAANGMMLYGQPDASMFAIPTGNGNDTVHNLRGHSDQTLKSRFAHGELRSVHPIEVAHEGQTRYAVSYTGIGRLTTSIALVLDSKAHRAKTAGTGPWKHLLLDMQAGAKILLGYENLQEAYEGTHNDQSFAFLEYAIMNGPRVAKLTNADVGMFDPEYLEIIIEKGQSTGMTRRQIAKLFIQLTLGLPANNYKRSSSDVQRLVLAEDTPVHFDADVKKRGGKGYETLPKETEISIRQAPHGFKALVPKIHPAEHWLPLMVIE